MKQVTDNYIINLRCVLWALESKITDFGSLFHFSGLLFCPFQKSPSTLTVLLPNITVLLHSYSPVLSPCAQSNTDKLAMCHGYPQCHKTVTAACRIIASPPLLSLSDHLFLCSPAQFYTHSKSITSHWRSVLLTVHPHHPTNKQHSMQHSIP